MLFAFVLFGLVSSVLRPEIGWEERLRKFKTLCWVSRKSLTQSINQQDEVTPVELVRPYLPPGGVDGQCALQYDDQQNGLQSNYHHIIIIISIICDAVSDVDWALWRRSAAASAIHAVVDAVIAAWTTHDNATPPRPRHQLIWPTDRRCLPVAGCGIVLAR